MSLLKWKSSKKTNPLKILMIQKFSPFKDFSCRIKRFTFLKIFVSRTMPPPIKFLQHEMIQSNPFVTLLVVRHFTRVSVLCNLFIFLSTNIVSRNLVSFRLFFACVVILFSEESFERFFHSWKYRRYCTFFYFICWLRIHKLCLKRKDALRILHRKARHKISVK